MESAKRKMSRSTTDNSILFNPGNTFDVKNSIQRNVGNPKKVIVEAGNRIGDKVQDETISFSENSNFLRSNSETVYDEYEEDKDYIRWQLPKIKKLPTLSSLLREWSAIQVILLSQHRIHFKKRINILSSLFLYYFFALNNVSKSLNIF
ncbi:PREDICTED: uncharacterized protein LOC108770184 [Trachymyrmex cornetzi]|uniref:uncharacterized protein LOC108770184 n=1 Tax=Trachymyrmex cornetzi TaxID=471704 RepID=UPI00084F217D|nr:PREDICTED: uncharacterized protein LOC108770184 [Trachymyrmex cornetzi]